MNPIHLNTFLCIWKHRSYTRAAAELALSQPAVSRQIRNLEHEIGVRLFEQIGRTLHLTSAGERLADEARRLLGDLQRVAESVRAIEEPGQGHLRIGASMTPGLYMVPPLLGAFHRTFPNVQIEYTVQNSVDIERRLLANELDLGFVGAQPVNPNLLTHTLMDDEIICFCGPSHALAERKRIAPASLERELWIVREPGSATRRLFDSALRKAGGHLGRTIVLDEPEAIKSLVASGLGLSFISSLGINNELQRGELVKLPVSGFSLRRPIYYAFHANKHLTPTMRAFIDDVRNQYGA